MPRIPVQLDTPTFFEVPRRVYTQMFNLLMDPTFDYFGLREPGYYHRDAENLHPELFPWGFVERVRNSEITETHRMPVVFEYDLYLALVVMVWADNGDPSTLNVQGLHPEYPDNETKGLMDIQVDIGSVFWPHKMDHFGVDGVIDWTFGEGGLPGVSDRSGMPPMSFLRDLAENPSVRIFQQSFKFRCVEKGSIVT